MSTCHLYLLSSAGYPLFNTEGIIGQDVYVLLRLEIELVMRNPAFIDVNNKDTYQPVHLHSLISVFVVPCLDSIIHQKFQASS